MSTTFDPVTAPSAPPPYPSDSRLSTEVNQPSPPPLGVNQLRATLEKVNHLMGAIQTNLDEYHILIDQYGKIVGGEQAQYKLLLTRIQLFKARRKLQREELKLLSRDFSKLIQDLPHLALIEESRQIAKLFDHLPDESLDKKGGFRGCATHYFQCCEWLAKCLNMDCCCELNNSISQLEYAVKRKI